MASTLLELTRATHEEVERMQKAVVGMMKEPPTTHKDNVFQSHKVAKLLDHIKDSSEQLAKIYEDKDGRRRAEAVAYDGNVDGMELYSLFYDRLREIKDYHRKFPNLPVENAALYVESYLQDPEVNFTGEEMYGRFLDLHASHEEYINLPKDIIGVDPSQIEYIIYLDRFYRFDPVTLAKRSSNKQYKTYATNLMEYLLSFYRRAQPLFDLTDALQQIDQEFEEKWLAGKSYTAEGDDTTLDKVKDPLYCDFCRRGFAKDTVFNAHLKGKKHIQAASTIASEVAAEQKDTAFLEYRISKLTELLSDTINETKVNITKKQARTYNEIINDLQASETVGDKEDEDEDEAVTKSKIENYPVGWDGKPIPFWLYKLNGLGVKFTCEICGGYTYMGRRDYERHFQEPRHAFGMSCLGIPNTRHFHEITSFADATALWKKIRDESKEKSFNKETEEEFEDSQGTVLNRKTFEDLKRQGFL